MKLNTHQTSIHEAVPRILESALRSVTGVFLHSSKSTTFRSFPLGTIGGAGNAQPATRLTLELDGFNPSQHALLDYAIRNGVLGTGQIRLMPGDNSPLYRILKLQCVDQGNELVIVVEGASSHQPDNLQICVFNKTFFWRIDTLRHPR